ncbi:MAG: transposase domain-containing protein [bacterium]|nr:transposase domain-containing protein [bacterium]
MLSCKQCGADPEAYLEDVLMKVATTPASEIASLTPWAWQAMQVEQRKLTRKAAKATGGEFALPPTEIPGRGKFAIYIQGGIQHGLWQL